MDFFKKKIVQIIAWVLLAASVVVLIIGGATADEMTQGVLLTAAIVSAVSALIAFITERVKEKK